MKKPYQYILLTLILFSFYQKDERNNINQAYQNLTPALRTEGLKNLPTLEALLKTAEDNLDPLDTLLANLYFSTGKIYLDFKIDTKKALDYNLKALDIRSQKLQGNNVKLAQSYHNTAMLLRLRGRFMESQKQIKQAINVKLAATKVDTASLLRSYHDLSMTYRELGASDDALELGQQMLSLSKALNDSVSMAKNSITIGSSYFQKNEYQNAFNFYKNAYTLFSEIEKYKPSVDIQIEKAACLNNLGVVSRSMNNTAESKRYLNESLALYNNLLSTVKDSTLRIYIGNVTMELAHTQGALTEYEKALQYFGNLSSTYVVECYNAIGDIYLKQNNNNKALEAYHKAIEKGISATNSIETNPTITDNVFPDLLKAFSNKADVLYKNNRFEIALETYKKCDTIIQKLHDYYQGDKAKYALSTVHRSLRTPMETPHGEGVSVYQKGIDIALQLYERDKTISYFEAAVNFSEKNKALILLENLKDNKAKDFAQVPDSIRMIEQDMKFEIAFWEKQQYEAPDSLKSKYQRELFAAKQNFNNFIQTLENQYPKYAHLKYTKLNTLSINDLQKQLDDKTIALSYALFDSTLYAFCFNKNEYRFYKNTLNKTHFAQFHDLRKSLANEKFITDSINIAEQVFIHNSHDFYKILLENPLKELNKNNSANRLRIIPDGFLGYVPFELLLTEKANTWKGAKTPYVLQNYAVSYAYSLQLMNEEGTLSGLNFGGFGIEYDDNTLNSITQQQDTTNPNLPTRARSENLSKLAYADDEVKNIASIIGAGQLFLNADATKLTFMRQAQNHGILHLAMHGAIDENNPLNSGLIFSKHDSTDNILRGYDLYAMQLRSGLAVLSACNTGNGVLKRNEGIMSVARAFAFAGCPSTVMSLWSIPDESTSKVMLSFYKNLKEGRTKDIALQKAKLEYLQTCSPQYSIPNYWGASVVIGNVEALEFKAWYKQPWAVFAGILLLFLAVLVLYRFWFKKGKTLQ